MKKIILALILSACISVTVSAQSVAFPNVNVIPMDKERVLKDQTTTYRVKMLQVAPPKFAVTATLPIDGKTLEMDQSRPCDLSEICGKGWTTLIRKLRVSDESDQAIKVNSIEASGWELTEAKTGWIKIDYEVDYSLLAENNYPAPRETAFQDADNFVVIGRSVFITTPVSRSITVKFDLLPTWNTTAPWTPIKKSKNSFIAPTVNELTENLLVMSRKKAEVIKVNGFRLSIIPMGFWQDVNGEVKEVLQKVVPVLGSLMRFKENVNYSLVLFPVLVDRDAGESFRGSFAFSSKSTPTRDNRIIWGQYIAHEIFHYWNGWRLQGTKYAETQWFQEGFTQYVADLAMVASGLVSEEEFRHRISTHIINYRKLTTSLENPGSKKGAPLYSGGALVALCVDIKIRQATNGKRNIGDFFRNLWQQTEYGKRKYEWNDIKAALEKTADVDWEEFFLAYIRGTEKLPLDKVFPLAGIRLIPDSDDFPRIESDSGKNTSTSAKSLWNKLIKAK